jgi:hypothetical protein
MPIPRLTSRASTSLGRRVLALTLSVVVASTACSDSTGPSDLQGPSNLWKPDPSSLPATGNYVVLVSDEGDWIGGGLSKVYQPPADTIVVGSYDNGQLYFMAASKLNGEPSPEDGFTGDFVGPAGMNPIAVGYYGGLNGFDGTHAGFMVLGPGRGCDPTGWFTVDGISYSGTTLTTLDLRVEQHCGVGGPAIHLAIHWRR